MCCPENVCCCLSASWKTFQSPPAISPDTLAQSRWQAEVIPNSFCAMGWYQSGWEPKSSTRAVESGLLTPRWLLIPCTAALVASCGKVWDLSPPQTQGCSASPWSWYSGGDSHILPSPLSQAVRSKFGVNICIISLRVYINIYVFLQHRSV